MLSLELRALAAVVLALGAALLVDRRTERRGFLPPGLAASPLRRGVFDLLLAAVLFAGVLYPLMTADQAAEIDVSSLVPAQLFLFHGVLVATLAAWYALGYAGVGGVSLGQLATGWMRQLGLKARRPFHEVLFGFAAGTGAWGLLLAVAFVAGIGAELLGGHTTATAEPPALIVWMAGLPVGVRLAIALSAGFVEELFFRGFLQPRAGIVFSSLLFALGHSGYGEPLFLVGLFVLSLYYGLLAWLRRSVWSAVAAHALFDGVQLLVVIPAVLRALEAGGPPSAWAVVFGRLAA